MVEARTFIPYNLVTKFDQTFLGAILGQDLSIMIWLSFAFTLLSIIICLTLMTITPTVFLRKSSQKFHKKTYQLQLKLYKSICIQTWVMMLFCIFPNFIMMLIILQKIPHTSIVVQILLSIMCMHGPVDLFVIG
jgi:hypothetical protein